MDESILPLRVYGASISYYTGKLEAYLRYKEIPYEYVAFGPRNQRKLRQAVHAAQIPAVELADGRFLSDTTPMIAWFEQRQPRRGLPAG
jgi:glutathione S-transferase